VFEELAQKSESLLIPDPDKRKTKHTMTLTGDITN